MSTANTSIKTEPVEDDMEVLKCNPDGQKPFAASRRRGSHAALDAAVEIYGPPFTMFWGSGGTVALEWVVFVTVKKKWTRRVWYHAHPYTCALKAASAHVFRSNFTTYEWRGATRRSAHRRIGAASPLPCQWCSQSYSGSPQRPNHSFQTKLYQVKVLLGGTQTKNFFLPAHWISTGNTPGADMVPSPQVIPNIIRDVLPDILVQHGGQCAVEGLNIVITKLKVSQDTIGRNNVGSWWAE
ncbi:hypothetical protein C8R46DRAFT_1040546 [Mycena filopes]|nr:hypothetical protein C8R46DRAFT_1040546 [Mycena filopes]